MKVAIQLAVAVGFVGLGLGIALSSRASRVYLPRMAIHMATCEASRVSSICVFTFHIYVSIHTASLEVHAHRVRPVTGLMAPRKQHLVVYCK